MGIAPVSCVITGGIHPSRLKPAQSSLAALERGSPMPTGFAGSHRDADLYWAPDGPSPSGLRSTNHVLGPEDSQTQAWPWPSGAPAWALRAASARAGCPYGVPEQHSSGATAPVRALSGGATPPEMPLWLGSRVAHV